MLETITYGDLKIKKLQGLAWYVMDCTLRGEDFDEAYYVDNISETMTDVELDATKGDETNLEKPTKFSYNS